MVLGPVLVHGGRGSLVRHYFTVGEASGLPSHSRAGSKWQSVRLACAFQHAFHTLGGPQVGRQAN